VQCTQCENVSVTFDPFNVLSVPIVSQKFQDLSIKYIPNKIDKPHLLFTLSVGEFVTISELQSKINQFIQHNIYQGVEVSERNSNEPILAAVCNRREIELLKNQGYIRTKDF